MLCLSDTVVAGIVLETSIRSPVDPRQPTEGTILILQIKKQNLGDCKT